MILPYIFAAAGLLVARGKQMHAGRVSSPEYNIMLRQATPQLLRSDRAKERCAEAIVNGYALVNAEYLNENPETPLLYNSGVYYCDDGRKAYDQWFDIPTTLERGCGNCTALTSWRLAELWRDGRYEAEAKAVLQHLSGGRVLYHLLVRFAGSNMTEDPSRILGMT